MPLNTSRLAVLAGRPGVTSDLVSNRLQGESLSATRANRDLGRESVRVRNEAVGLQNKALRDQLEQLPVLQQIRKKAAQGDKLAQLELASLEPGKMLQIQQVVDNMGAAERARKLQSAQTAAAGIMSQIPLEKDPQKKAQLIQGLGALGYFKEAMDMATAQAKQTAPGAGQFTLGDTRFGPSGNVIASNPEDPKPGKVTSKNVKLDDGRVVAATVSEDGTVQVGTRTLEPGKFSFISQQATGTPGEFQGTKAQVGKDIRQLDFIDRTINQIDTIVSQVEANPTLVGVPGSIRRAGQTLTGGIADISSLISDSQANEASTIGQSLLDETELTEEEKNSFFNDPTISKLRLFENNVGLALARTRHPEGRVPVDIIKRSIDDAKLTGFTSSRDVINRLKEIQSEMHKVRAGLADRTNSPPEVQPTRPTSELPTSDLTDEEIEAEIQSLRGGGNGF